MTFVSFTLTDPASGLSSVLLPRDGLYVMSLDVQPSVRVVSEERTGGAGTYDTTVNLSEAALTLSLRVFSDTLPLETLMAELGPLLNPGRRPALICTDDQWATPRQLTVRFDSKTAPVDNPVSTDIAVSWKVPAGAWEDSAVREYMVSATVTAGPGLIFTVTTGTKFTVTTGQDFPPTAEGSDSIVSNGGDLPVPWTARLYGPCTGPKLYNDTAGQVLAFTDGLVLAAGEYVEIDPAARTALGNSDPSASRLAYLDFGASDWWLIDPGDSLIRYAPSAAGAGAVAVLDFVSRYQV